MNYAGIRLESDKTTYSRLATNNNNPEAEAPVSAHSLLLHPKIVRH
jgi:hypothetical protein